LEFEQWQSEPGDDPTDDWNSVDQWATIARNGHQKA
jgi:hypothetical protein